MSAAMSPFSVDSLEGSYSETESHHGGKYTYHFHHGTKLTILGVTVPTDRFTETAKNLEAIIANLKVGPIEDTEKKMQGLFDWLNRERDEAVVEDDLIIDNMSQTLEDTVKFSADTSNLSARMDDPVIPTLNKIVALLDSMEQQRSNDKKLSEERLSKMELQRSNESMQIHQRLAEIGAHIAALRENVNDSSVTTNERFNLITTDIANIEHTLKDNTKIFRHAEASITTLSNTANDHTNKLRSLGICVDRLGTTHDGTIAATEEHLQRMEKIAFNIEINAKDNIPNVVRQLHNIEKTVGNVDACAQEAAKINTEYTTMLQVALSTIGKSLEDNSLQASEHHSKIEANIQALNDQADFMSSQLSTIQERFVHDKMNERMTAVSAHLESLGSTVTTKLTDIEKKIGSIVSRIATVDENQILSSSDIAQMERRLCGTQKKEIDAVKEHLSSIRSAIDCASEAMCTSTAVWAMEKRIYKSQDAQTKLITTEMAATVNMAAVCSSADIIREIQNMNTRSCTIEKKIKYLVENSEKNFGNLVSTRGNTAAILDQLEKVSSHTRQIPGLSIVQTKNYMTMMDMISKKGGNFGNDIEAISKKMALTESFITNRVARLVEVSTSVSKTTCSIANNTFSVKTMHDTLQGLTKTLSRLQGNSDDVKRDVQGIKDRQKTLEISLLTAEEAEPGTVDVTVNIGSSSHPRTVTFRLPTRDKAQLNTIQLTLRKMTTDLSSHLEAMNEHSSPKKENLIKISKHTHGTACLDVQTTTSIRTSMPDSASTIVEPESEGSSAANHALAFEGVCRLIFLFILFTLPLTGHVIGSLFHNEG